MRGTLSPGEPDINFYRLTARIDCENEQARKRERAIEAAFGITLARCPVCGGVRENPTLGNACAYCGKVTECGN